MASPITHFIVGAAVALPVMDTPSLRGIMPRWAILVSAGLFGVAPDFDTYNTMVFGAPDESLFSHRGFFHSPFFLALLAFAVARLVTRTRAWSTLGLWWTCAAVTHPLLDMLTDGGWGVTLFFPFTTGRFFFPWNPIRVTPLDFGLFFHRAADILFSELPFCVAAFVLGIAARAARRRLLFWQ